LFFFCKKKKLQIIQAVDFDGRRREISNPTRPPNKREKETNIVLAAKVI
jgi:hypothetical protein